ncbi:hypothetical protein [Halorubrum cibi]|uniref:Uncharacterized protein n=1 Tax=Halorubrum cibi TaxID=413815 RepID=A0A521B4H9_9EURY|nr:hypothetical protein [Halorubrum cibi]SMO41973.1 hypothetical protein SAMN06264867_1027 [Halorubrum cibi]
MNLPLGLGPFADQSPRDHALVLALGALACLVGYVGSAALFFGLGALDHGGSAAPRRVASVFASLACWTVYAVAFVRGRGGPVTDVLAYPIATVGVVPFAARWLAFGPAWGALRDRIGFFLFRPDLLIDAAALVVPGIALCASLLTLWASRLGEAEVRAWQRRHLSAEFREAFVEEADFEG